MSHRSFVRTLALTAAGATAVFAAPAAFAVTAPAAAPHPVGAAVAAQETHGLH
jgi:hypothetical protein